MNTVNVYDPCSNTWTNLANLPFNLGLHSATSVN